MNPFRHVAPAAALAAIVSTVASSASAQDTGPGNPNVAETLDPISVTATRNPVSSFEYPGMVTVIGREEMMLQLPSTVGDVLRDVPGVNFTGGPRRTGEVPAVRGFSGANVILLLDGARQNFISGHDGRLFTDPFFLREAEVVRGASSSLYGSGGTGGVMEFRTLEAGDLIEPGKAYGVEVNGGLQSMNSEWATGIAGAARVSDSTALTGGLVMRRSFNIDLGNGKELSSSDDIISGLAKARSSWGAHTAELSFQRFTNDALEPNNGQSGTATDMVTKDTRSDTARLAYGYKPSASPWVDLDVLVYRVDTHQEEVRLTTGGAGPVGQRLEQMVETLGLRVDNRSRFGLGANGFSILTYGVEAYRDSADGLKDGGAREGVPNAEHRQAAAFLQGQIDLDSLWGEGTGISVLPGIRFDSYVSESGSNADNSEDAISPKLAVQVRPIRPLTVSASYAYAFRAPTVGELYPTGVHFVQTGFGTNSFIPNPNLRPQKTRTFEVTTGLQFGDVVAQGDNAQIKAAHYWTRGKDFIDSVVTTPSPPACFAPNCNGTTQSRNVADARLSGYEIEASYDQPRFLMSASFAHIDGENEATGAPLGVLTPDSLNVHAAVRVPERRMQIGWRYEHAWSFDNTRTASLRRGAFDVHDAYVQWTAGEGSGIAGFGVVLGVDNIFDENYARIANNAAEPGRNLKALVRYQASW